MRATASVVKNHQPNAHGRRKFNMANREAHGGRRSPTVVALAGNDAPLVLPADVENHAPNNKPAYAFSQASTRAHMAKPAPTMTTPEQNAPFDEGGVAKRGSGYPALLDRELPSAAPAPCGLRLAEFFCCGGGIGLGFRSAGYELAFANDINPRAAETYGRNLGHAPLVRDIREAGGRDVPPGVDVLTGGFPCVTFSMAGRRMGVDDDVHGKLYLEMCRVISEVRPRYFAAENVQGILIANGGAAVKLVGAAFLRLGYRVAWELVNMAEHGVPQTRMRVIFFGVRLDQWRGSFIFPRKTHRLAADKKAPRWLRPAVNLRQAIGDLPEPGEEVMAVSHGDSAHKRSSGTGVGGFHNSQPRRAGEPAHSQPTSPNVKHVRRKEVVSARNADFHNGHRDAGPPSVAVVSSEAPELRVRRPQGHDANAAPVDPKWNASARVAHGGRPAPTMVSGTRGNEHPLVDGMRRMTVRECARVQSFPDWYEFAGSQADGYGAVGNAVPPLYAKRLALAILDYDKREIV